MVNRVILVGNLTRDAEPVATTSGSAVTRMRLATNSYWKDAAGQPQEAAEFHNVVAFGRLAEVCAEHCERGRRLYIEGRLKTREYEGRDGAKKTATEIVAETIKLLQSGRPSSDTPRDAADPPAAIPA